MTSGIVRRLPVGAGLYVLAGGFVSLVVAPLVFLTAEAIDDGWKALEPLIFRGLTAELLWHTLTLLAGVTAGSVLVGTAAAWLLECTDLPFRRLWAVVLVIPVGIPDFATAFGWTSLTPAFGGYVGALVVMVLAVYPLVMLPVAASLRHMDPTHEEIARSLGAGRVKTFVWVTLGEARTAILGGALLVSLVVLSEYGAFEILGYQTFTTEIFSEWKAINTAAACGLSLVLVIVGAIVVVGEGQFRGRRRTERIGPQVARHTHGVRLGRTTGLGLFFTFGLAVAAVGVPLGAIVYWISDSAGTALPASATVWVAALHTVGYSAGAGVVATVAALPLAMLSVRRPGPITWVLERTGSLVLVMPGLLIALAFAFASERWLRGFGYQSSWMLVITYAVMFFPLALVSARASVARSPRRLEEVARSLGRGRLEVLWRVTLRLLAPGLLAAFCLVFLESATELTATLVLIPTGAQTLATQFWAFHSAVAYHQAAIYAAVMVGIAVLPSVALQRWFDRGRVQTA